jgi:hypothetical protein
MVSEKRSEETKIFAPSTVWLSLSPLPHPISLPRICFVAARWQHSYRPCCPLVEAKRYIIRLPSRWQCNASSMLPSMGVFDTTWTRSSCDFRVSGWGGSDIKVGHVTGRS